MKNLDKLKDLLNQSLAISENEKIQILDFISKNPEKLDEIIKIFEKEKMQNLEIIKKIFNI